MPNTISSSSSSMLATHNVKALPAHETKHIPLLLYPFRDNNVFELTQSNDGANNGTALWLGAQILSAFLTDTLCIHSTDLATSSRSSIPSSTPLSRTPRAIELGSGVGLSALVLAAQGWSVLATDTPAVVHAVLRPNVLRNTRIRDSHGSTGARLLGTVQARSLDWSVPPEKWVWDNPESVTGEACDIDNKIALRSEEQEEELLAPPFDLILTADTIYSTELVTPLLRTLKHLVLISSRQPSESFPSRHNPRHKKSYPPVYLALERRDPALMDSFFSQAREIWRFDTQRVPTARVRRAVSRNGLGEWKREDWEGVEVWRMSLRHSNSESNANESTPAP